MNIHYTDGTQAMTWVLFFYVLYKILLVLRIDMMCGMWYNYLNI